MAKKQRRKKIFTLINSIIPLGSEVFERRSKYSIMSLVWSPTETAAYNEYAVNWYSCINSGRHTG